MCELQAKLFSCSTLTINCIFDEHLHTLYDAILHSNEKVPLSDNPPCLKHLING